MVEVDYRINKVHRQLTQDKVIDIQFLKYTSIFCLGKELESNIDNKTLVLIGNIMPNIVYHIKRYEPTYVLEKNGFIDYEYKLYPIC